MLKYPPLSLYIHIPWCIRKCPYCDFNSHTLHNTLPEKEYIDALIDDLEHDLAHIEHHPIVSIFIGGGTPSLLSATAIDSLLNAIQKRCQLTPDLEITLEANPGTVEKNRFAGFRKAGINRLSIGIQSFQKEKLVALGRIHDGDEAKRAAETAIEVGFDNFNLDLMHGLPNQTIEEALNDLKTAISFSPTHLSWYQLTLEANTLFHKFPPKLPEDELIWDMQDAGQQLLSENGFQQYEISAYSKPNLLCQHNQNYWEFGDYLGIGAGAHSKTTDIQNKKINRVWKIKNPKDYLAKKNNFYIGEEKIISESELPFEFMLNALRLYRDIPVTLFESRTGLPLSSIENQLKIAAEKELLRWDKKTISPTETGRRFYNDLVAIFVPENKKPI